MIEIRGDLSSIVRIADEFFVVRRTSVGTSWFKLARCRFGFILIPSPFGTSSLLVVQDMHPVSFRYPNPGSCHGPPTTFSFELYALFSCSLASVSLQLPFPNAN